MGPSHWLKREGEAERAGTRGVGGARVGSRRPPRNAGSRGPALALRAGKWSLSLAKRDRGGSAPVGLWEMRSTASESVLLVRCCPCQSPRNRNKYRPCSHLLDLLNDVLKRVGCKRSPIFPFGQVVLPFSDLLVHTLHACHAAVWFSILGLSSGGKQLAIKSRLLHSGTLWTKWLNPYESQ